MLSMSSCKDYLDVNTDPDNPTSVSATLSARLPWIQNYFAYAWGTAGMRANTIGGILTQLSTTGGNGYLAAWNPIQGSCTTVYQNWYIGSAVNINPMIDKALATGAYHYAGAGYCIKAMGFMMMLDMHGELPITEAFTGKYNPSYDDGKTMYNLCLEYIDEAINYLNMGQTAGAATLSAGDLWNGGNVQQWIKLCYGLKARFLLKVSKKADLFQPDAVLAALDNAMQSNDDNTSMKHYNVEGDEVNFTVSDPYQTAAFWNCVAYGTGQRLTKWYVNLLNNSFTGGSGVIDPRLSKLVPAMMTNIVLGEKGAISTYDWTRSVGVDMMYSNKRRQGNIITTIFATSADIDKTYTIDDAADREQFIADASKIHKTSVDGSKVTVTYQKGSAYCNTTNYRNAGDTIYVNMRSNSMSTSGRGINDLFYYPAIGYDYVAGTGTFYARPNSDSDFLTYAEMFFIKAEIGRAHV